MGDFPPLELSFPDRRDWVLPHILAERARMHGDRPFLEELHGPALSYGEADREVNRLAQGLRGLGVAQGDRVLLMLPNCVDFMLLWWAVNRLGAIEVSVNNAYKGYFLEHLVENSGARVMVVEALLLEAVRASEARLPGLETLIVRGAGGEAGDLGLRRLRPLPLEAVPAGTGAPPDVEVSYRDLCALMYTSGTTGPSKGVMLPHGFCYLFADATVNLTRLTAEDTYLVSTPLYHANAPIMQVSPALLRGGRAVIAPRFSAGDWVAHVRAAGATATNLLGVMMDFIHRQPPRPDDRDHRLRVVLGQPAPAAIVEDFKRRFGIPKVLEYYGMTEIGLVTMMPWDDVRPGSCGQAVSEWFELRIADPETDEERPVGEVGELLVRPRVPWVFNQGYWAMPDRTAEALRNVWFHTGDALRRDEDGYYYFVDRIRDVIRRRAVNISSYDVERVVGEHPAVAECAAVAVPAEFAGGEDEIKVCLVLREGAPLDPRAFCAWCEDRMPHFAVPRYVETLRELPRTPNNKIQKYLLRQSGTAAAWDRVAAGYRLREEVRKEAARRARARADAPR